jgi:polyhydroxyalkanoate synthase
MTVLERVARSPLHALEFANVLLTTDDAVVGATPREVVWTHRGTTLYRYRSAQRTHAIPMLLVFALINRPEIFDLRPGGSLVEFLLGEGFDVFLVDWGVPGEEDAEMGLENYVCDALHWAVRETQT